MRTVGDVINFLVDCRDSHVNQSPDRRFHDQCVKDYDQALKVLRKLRGLV